MKHIAEIIGCGVALAWLYSASVAGETVDLILAGESEAAHIAEPSERDDPDALLLSGGDESGLVMPPDPKIPVVAQPEDVDQAKVEKRLEEKSARTKQRTAEAEKDVAEREANAQQGQAGNAAK